jgi:hypothetical protein
MVNMGDGIAELSDTNDDEPEWIEDVEFDLTMLMK